MCERTGRMKSKKSNKIFTVIVFMALAFGSLQFVMWISQMAFENTCVELQEQYIGTEIGEVIDTIENSVNFGKELKNYYGMDGLLEQVSQLSQGDLRACVLDRQGEALYLSFDKSDENLKILSEIYSGDCQKEIGRVTERGMAGEKIQAAGRSALVFPIYRHQKELMGHFLVLYQPRELLEKIDFSVLERMKWIVWGSVSICLFLFFFVSGELRQEKRYARYVPTVFIMLGMFLFILLMFQKYQKEYSAMVSRNAQSAAEYLRASVEEMVEKGLPAGQLGEISEYFNRKAEGNAAIESIAVVKSYYDTGAAGSSADDFIINLTVAEGLAQLTVVVNRSYLQEKIYLMTLTFGAIFIICLMITYEMTHLAEIISVRAGREARRTAKEQMGAVGGQVKLLSFLSYLSIYSSMSYTAVIMRNWDASLFGLPKAASASLPLTVELLSIMLCSIAVQRFFRDMKLNHLLFFVFLFLALGNAACIATSSPYVLLGLRAFCGIGFGLLKYWLNSIVAAGSADSEALGDNYAMLNAGLLGGITAGASLGAVLAQSLGYQFNYLFTGGMCLLIMVFAWIAMPWKMLHARRLSPAGNAGQRSVRIMDVFRDKTVRKAILLGDIPLNIGLMYVVAFLPVYMDYVGQPTVATSYAYLVNGLAGVYLGPAVMRLFRNLSGRSASAVALLTGAAGILILVLGSSIGMILLSVGIMGLFDGYGTPVITRFFTGLPQVRGADTASMLTVFNSVGSAVQILCPMLYNLLIQPDGSTLYLLIFGAAYTVSAVLFYASFSRGQGTDDEEGGVPVK